MRYPNDTAVYNEVKNDTQKNTLLVISCHMGVDSLYHVQTIVSTQRGFI